MQTTGADTDFNPLAPHGARPHRCNRLSSRRTISIHSPRTGRDLATVQDDYETIRISIHSPRTGRDAWVPHVLPPPENISIHSPRTGRDHGLIMFRLRRKHFNPLAPHGARLSQCSFGFRITQISIHSPRTGRDVDSCGDFDPATLFQSTRPARGETLFQGSCRHRIWISIHSPRTGRDADFEHVQTKPLNISIHSPRTGRDRIAATRIIRGMYFNPLAPHGARR